MINAVKPMGEELERLKSVCKYGYYILGVMAAFLIVVTIVVFAMGIASYFHPEYIDPDDLIIWVDGQSLEISPTMASMTCIFASVILTVFTATVVVLMRIAGSIRKEYTPFTDSNARGFKAIAAIYVVFAIGAFVAKLAFPEMLAEMNSPTIEFLLIGAFAYCISLIFRYGIVLQKESDETL